MTTARAKKLRPALTAGLPSFRATDTQRSRMQVRGGGGDAHADDYAREALRDLSRDLERNAEGYQILIHGSARLMGAPTPRPLVGDQAWRERVVAAWRQRAQRSRGGFDARGLHSWPSLCATWWRQLWRDGDLALLPLADGTIATVEADLIAGGSSKNQHRRVIGGVELDTDDRVLGYHIAPRTAFGTPDTNRATFYPVDRVCYLAHLWSSSNTRGVPLVTAGLDNQERIDALVEAEVISAEQASTIYGSMQREVTAGQASPAVPLAEASSAPISTRDPAAPTQVGWTAGTYFDLPPGVKWNPHSPTRPNLNTVEMMRQILRQSCVHVGIPFHVLYCDFMGVNWSGNRGLVQLTRDALRWWRQTLLQPFIAPLWSWWLAAELSAGRLPMPTSAGPLTADAIYAVDWDWPDPEWPDPSREAQALDLRLAQGTSSLTREIGPDWTLIQDERQRELLRADGLYVERCRAAAAAVAAAGDAIPGLTWREIINRDASPNTVSTIPLQSAPKPDDASDPEDPPPSGTDDSADDDADDAQRTPPALEAVLLSYDEAGRPVLRGVGA